MSEPHEIRGPYEAYVVAVKRKDGRCPDLSKVLASSNGDCPIMLFDYAAEAKALKEKLNQQFLLISTSEVSPYGVFKVQVTFVEEVK